MGVKVGVDCRAYRNTGTYVTPVWNEITIARDVTIAKATDMHDALSRGNRWKKKVPGHRDAPVTLNLLTDAAVDDYDALQTAWLADTIQDMAFANGPIAATGTKFWRADYYISGFPAGEPLEDVCTTDCTLDLAYSSNDPVYITVP